MSPALSDRLDLFVVGGEGTRWAGVLLYAVGGALRIAPVFALGERFSGLVAIQPGHELVTDGLYRRIRNPSYLGLLVGTLGWSLAFRSLVGVLLTALLVVPLVARMQRRRGAARRTLRRGLRRLSRPHLAAGSVGLLRPIGLPGDKGLGFAWRRSGASRLTSRPDPAPGNGGRFRPR